ncbi:MAG: sugar ABC transporter ATP-binding protein [Solirubrobacterales bacterium]|nr:sugar ABC transporter ATP-binding protein [Solirubrobacterales bacterium]
MNDAAMVLEVRGARKSFGYVRALRGVDLALHEGEILALLGDNGAGKSTLIKAVSGVHPLDEGEIFVGGERASIKSSADARGMGIETVYQDLAMFDNLDVPANFFVGREPTRPSKLGSLGFLRERQMVQTWKERAASLGISIPNPRQTIGLMSGGQRQSVAVARAIAFADRVVILDEPTAALGLRESAQVLELVRKLPDHGVSVLLISHNMEHVQRVAHRAVVLRQGEVVGEAVPSPDTHEALVQMIMGAQGVNGEPQLRSTSKRGK